jgi:hypothetical protein
MSPILINKLGYKQNDLFVFFILGITPHIHLSRKEGWEKYYYNKKEHKWNVQQNFPPNHKMTKNSI